MLKKTYLILPWRIVTKVQKKIKTFQKKVKRFALKNGNNSGRFFFADPDPIPLKKTQPTPP